MRKNGIKVWVPVFAQIDLKDCTIYLLDGSGESLEVKIGEGNLTYTESRNIQYTLDRGQLDEVREGDEVPMDVKLDFTWEYLRGSPTSGSTPSVEEALKNIGNAANWTSSDSDGCRPYAVDIKVVYAPQPSNCGDKETITLLDFRYEKLDHDMKAGTVSVTGKCNVTQATVIRAAQSS
jgi:hypothetical protein